MTLSESSRKILQEKGILFLEKENDSCFILKATEASGNSLPGYTSVPIVRLSEKGETVQELTSNAPVMMLFRQNNHFVLSCWNWVPGPGPGDFEKTFDNEQDVVAFIDSYYFGENDYFEARRVYEIKQLAR